LLWKADCEMAYHVLVTDDNEVNRSLIIQIICRSIEDIIFFQAADGEECIKILETQEIDLNILDLLMPKMDGFEVVRRMKANQRFCDIPIIINSAVEDIPSIQKILVDGANDYFSKPLLPNEMKVFLPLKVKNALIRYEQHKKIKQINEINRHELQLASALQTSMMSNYKIFSREEMFGDYIPCNDIGGDFYDCFERNGRLWFLIADVSGHGLAAAMVSIMLKGMLGELVSDSSEPGALLERLNQNMVDILGTSNQYLVSAFAGCIDESNLFYANAGHPYPVIYHSLQKKTEILKQNGFLLGAFENVDFPTQKVGIQKDDWIISYTDGIFGNQYGSRSAAFDSLLDEILHKVNECNYSPESLIESVIDESGGSRSDDVSMMIIRMR